MPSPDSVALLHALRSAQADPCWDDLATAEPAPGDALCLKEAIENLPEELQVVAVGKLYGKTDEELAGQLGYKSAETIRLAKRRIEKKWQAFFGDDLNAG